MTKKARVIDGIATDVMTGDPAEFFHRDIAAQFTSVPDDVVDGARLVSGNWTPPEEVTETVVETPRRRIVSRPEFKLLFTSAERVAIRQARDYAGDDAALKGLALTLNDFFEIVEDPALTGIDLTLDATIEGVQSLEAVSLIGSGRAETILAGMPGTTDG